MLVLASIYVLAALLLVRFFVVLCLLYRRLVDWLAARRRARRRGGPLPEVVARSFTEPDLPEPTDPLERLYRLPDARPRA